ncbi:hypothetical protein [Glycomyces buryatensis]|uniref:Uncharacterized protein n=1 Tax=Glycomyces buryatensis TaxID=2570927 RepID=A0A4S8QMB9_9ACTN|nr:hypothetical protein [Glycomyces buryatensis]THV41874.1 hypothetical protein FAB82_09135 [Glycomyces buryatensis]
MDRNDVPLEEVAKLYGVVVHPEEARRFYRRQAWLLIAVVWVPVLLFLMLTGFILIVQAFA